VGAVQTRILWDAELLRELLSHQLVDRMTMANAARVLVVQDVAFP
jgi:hypothetical protein